MWFEGLAAAYDTEANTLTLYPVVRQDNGIRPANEKESAEILGNMAQRNGTLADGTWLDGWRAFCESKREYYTKAVAAACTEEGGEKGVERFAHYLDCEAHTDVWRELFKTHNHRNELN